jgi:hypothetical protein
LRNEDDYYTNGTGARKALITNFEEVKNAGWNLLSNNFIK